MRRRFRQWPQFPDFASRRIMLVDVKASGLESFQITLQGSNMKRRHAEFFEDIVLQFLDGFAKADTFQNL